MVALGMKHRQQHDLWWHLRLRDWGVRVLSLHLHNLWNVMHLLPVLLGNDSLSILALFLTCHHHHVSLSPWSSNCSGFMFVCFLLFFNLSYIPIT